MGAIMAVMVRIGTSQSLFVVLKYFLRKPFNRSELIIKKDSVPDVVEFIDTSFFIQNYSQTAIRWKLKTVYFEYEGKKLVLEGKALEEVHCFYDIRFYFNRLLQKSEDHLLPVENFGFGIDTNSNFLEDTENRVKLYVSSFVNDRLRTEMSYEKHLSIFKQYIDDNSKDININYFHVDRKSFSKYLNKKQIEEWRFLEFMVSLFIAKVIEIHSMDYQNTSKLRNYVLTVGVTSLFSLEENNIRKKIGISDKKIFIKAPQDRRYWYEDNQFNYRLFHGGLSSVVFKPKKINTYTFLAFYELFRKDGTGEYTVEEVCKSYKKVSNGGSIMPREIGDKVSNIRDKKFKDAEDIREKIEWEFSVPKNKWIFRIND